MSVSRTHAHRALPALFLGVFLTALPVLAADQFVYVSPPSTAVTYVVNSSPITFVVNARQSGSLDTGYTGPATVGFYKNSLFPGSLVLADPQAEFETTTVTPTSLGIGTAVLNFTAGAATFRVTFQTGSDEALIVVRNDPAVSLINSQGGVYHVRGFSEVYYAKDANDNTTPAVYPTATDQLTTTTADVEDSPDHLLSIPSLGPAGIGAPAYVITGVNGRYAFGGAAVVPNLVVRRLSGSGATNIFYRIILDYDGDLTDYDNPDTDDAVLEPSASIGVPGSFVTLGQGASAPTLISSTPVDETQEFINGKVILRVWAISAGSPSQMKIKAATADLSSFISVPFSDSNVSPVQAEVVPDQVLSSNPTVMEYRISNFSGIGVTRTRFKVPGNPSTPGTNWTFQATPTTNPATSGSISYTDPSGTADGEVDIFWNPAIPNGSSVTVTLNFSTTSSFLSSTWDFGFLAVEPGTALPDPNSAKNIQTLDVPPAPGSITPSPANFLSAGNRIDLSWPQVTLQAANGYILMRRDYPAGSPATIQTIVSNATTSFQDTTAVNLAPYEYIIRTKNPVAVSAPVASVPVTAFANPGPPTGVTALTGNGTVRLNWATPTPVTGGYPLGGFRIFRSTSPSMSSATTVTTTGLVTTYDDATATNGTTWYYTIASLDTQFVSGLPGTDAHISTVSTPVVNGFPPGNPPTNPSASLVSVSPTPDIQVAWTAPTGVLNSPVTGYQIERAINNLVFSAYTTVAAGPYDDTGVAAGNFYVYRISAFDSAGILSNPSAGVTGRVGPSAPTGFTASPSLPTGTAVTLTWNPNPVPENVVNYNIYRNSVFLTQTGASPTSFLNSSGLSVGTDYVYEIEAVDNQPVTGPLAAVTTALRPTVPTGLAVSVLSSASNDIDVDWTSVITANANAVSLSVIRDLTPTSPTTFTITPASATSTTVTGNLANTTYYFSLRTHNSFGSSPLTTPVTVTTFPPAVTLNPITLDPGTGARIVSWSTLTAPVTAYRVYRSQNSSGPYNPVQTILGASPTMPVTLSASIQPGQIYYYRVRAINPTGEGQDSNTQAINIPPSVPVGLTAVSGTDNAVTQVDISWVANPGVENVQGYTLYRSLSNATTAAYSQVVSIAGTTYSDTTVTGGTLYYYLVKAHSNTFVADSGLDVANAVSVTAYALPNPPVALAAIAGTGQVAVTWNSAGVANTYPIQSYRVYQSTSAGVTGSAVVTVTAAVTVANITGLTNGTTYYFMAQAVDNQGHAGPLAGQVSAMPVVPPSVPTNVNADDGDNAVQVTWNASTAGTLPLGGYRIYRVDPPGSPVTTAVATVGVSFTGYIDTSVTNLTTYVYWVQALDSAGVSMPPHGSGLSAAVTVQPQAQIINPPDLVTGSFGASSVTIFWSNAPPGPPLSGYVLNRATASAGPYSAVVTIAAGAGPYSHEDTTVVPGTRYWYYVHSVANTLPVSISVNSAIVTGIPVPPPAPPTPLTHVDGSDRVTLNWGASAGTGAVTILHYVIYRVAPPNGTGAGAVSIGISQGPQTTFTDTGLAAGTDMEYYISAKNSNFQEGALSAPVTGFPYIMAAPGGVGSTSTGTAITLNWTDGPASSYPVLSYSIVRTPLGGGTPVTFTDTGSPYLDNTGLILGQLHAYTVQGVDDKGHLGTASAPVTDGISTPPPAPTPVSYLAGNDQNLIDWAPAPATPPAGTLPVSFYILTRTSGGPVTLPATQTWYLDTAASNGVTVNYTLVAVDATGQFSSAAHFSALPAVGSAAPLDTILNPPTGLTAVSLSTNSIRLNWTPSADQGMDIDRYEITRSGSFSGTYGNPIIIDADLFPPQVSVTVTGLSANSTYYFRMQAFERNTSVTSSFSNHAYATTLPATGGGGAVTGDLFLDRNVLLLFNAESLTINVIPSESAQVTVKIYTISGQPIRILDGGAGLAGAQGSVIWDGLDANGSPVASGLYLIEATAGKFHQVKKVAVVK